MVHVKQRRILLTTETHCDIVCDRPLCKRIAVAIMNDPMRLIAAYDRSPAADEAFDTLSRAGLPENTEAMVVSVAEPWPIPAAADGGLYFPGPPLTDLKSAEEAARVAGDRIGKDFPGWSITVRGMTGPISRGILSAAESWNADLIVVGSRGRFLPGRNQFGSISQQIATSASCSVRIGRERNVSRNEPIRLLVAVDGSPDSDRAVEELLHRAWPPNTKVWVVTAIGTHSTAEEGQAERDEAAVLHAGLLTRLHEKGLSAASIIDAMDPRYTILTSARELDVDCIVIGARGRTPFERTLLGSTSAAVAGRAGCSVEIVRK